MRIILSLAVLAGAPVVEGAVQSCGAVERVSAFSAALDAHNRLAADVVIVEWSTLSHPAALRALTARTNGRRPYTIVIGHDSSHVDAVMPCGVDDVVLSSDDGFRPRLVVAIERGRRARDAAREGAAFHAIATSQTALRYIEHDLRQNKLVRAGDVAPSSRRLSRSELEGLGVDALIDGPSYAKLADQTARAIEHFRKTGELSTIVVDVAFKPGVRSRGTRRFFLALTLDDQGEPTILRGFSSDTTELVQATADYQRLFESAHDAILIFDPQDEIVLQANPHADALYGLERGGLVGTSLRSVSLDADRGARFVAQTLAARGGVVSFEAEQIAHDGRRLVIEVNASRVEYQGHEAILSINRDVTARKQAEAASRLQEQALQESAKMEALGRLAGGIAHDFNNLLMVITTCSDVLSETLGKDHPARLEIDDIVDASERAKNLIAQLLAFGRRAPQSPQAVDLGEVVFNLHGLLRRVVGEDIQLETTFAEDLPSVLADPGQMEQLLVNLVVNARDAIDSSGTISIHTEATPDGVSLVVKDTGSGMDDATRVRIFEPFFTTKEQGKGTGLGLSTVYAIVRDSGGKITVESKPKQGSTFRITFPIHQAAPESVRRARAERQSRPGTEVILLVEDERAVRRILARELSRFGYSVLEAEDGEAALEAAKHTAVDVLVTDVVMPKMSGDELAERLKVRWPRLEVIFMSGHTDRGKVRDIGERGLGPLLRKPFHPSDLIDLVRAGLSGVARPA